MGHIGQKLSLGAVGAGLAGHSALQLLPHAQIAVHVLHPDLLGVVEHGGAVGFLALQRVQHCIAVAAGLGVGIAEALGLQADLYLLRVAGHIVLHRGQYFFGLGVVPGVHRALKDNPRCTDEICRVHFGQLGPELVMVQLGGGRIPQLVVEEQPQRQGILRQKGKAVEVGAFQEGFLRLVQPAQIAADFRQIAVDVDLHRLIAVDEVFLRLLDGLQRLLIAVLVEVGHAEVVVLIGVALNLLVLLRDLQPLPDVKAGKLIFLLKVRGGAHQVEAGNNFRAVFIVMVVDDKRLQNLAGGAVVTVAVKLQRIAEIGQHPHAGFFRLLFQDIGIKRLALFQRGIFELGLLLGKFFIAYHNRGTILKTFQSVLLYHIRAEMEIFFVKRLVLGERWPRRAG